MNRIVSAGFSELILRFNEALRRALMTREALLLRIKLDKHEISFARWFSDVGIYMQIADHSKVGEVKVEKLLERKKKLIETESVDQRRRIPYIINK